MKTRSSSILVAVVSGFMAVLPNTQAVSPTPDGCYPNYTKAEGCNALSLLTTGAGNTGVDWYPLFFDATGNFNTGVGAGASNVICIGAQGANVSNSCYIDWIYSQPSTSGVAVFVNETVNSGRPSLLRRFKEDIKPMDKTSEAIPGLKPVTFLYKRNLIRQA